MESKTLPPVVDYSSNVDTSSAFRSVKEAVEIFGERFLNGEILLPKQETPSWKSTHSSRTSWRSFSPPREIEEPPSLLVNSLKKLESELEETKKELKELKEKESETKAALASLNSELQKKATQGLPLVVSGDRKVVKKKPMIPFLGGLFSKRKGKPDANSIVSPLYASSQMHWI
ncbi:hypothetical protein L1987_40586 [Smallanthus sonchifolius]|uniref:Uncharacterized protein n=1 Tax=Smallanthus sonchifolius TaxID=185202 RepID=A0ACB9GU10_9ASTR|nr:hypothetical protein L1987_40586 [Smallanthus sonchifolius]